MKYVFLTYSISGISGGPSYVSNKTKWLSERGWDVIVFDHYGTIGKKGVIEMENLRQYERNRMMELFFPPSYFSSKQRERILRLLVDIIGRDDCYVVESNTPRLSLWGELLASRIGAKHLILEIGERLEIRSQQEFDYVSFKFNRNEWFAIKPQAVKLKFSNWRLISEEEANNHYFSASMGVTIEDVPIAELNGIQRADYNILSFGRRKPYFESLIDEVILFSGLCPDKRVNLVIMGAVDLKEREVNAMNETPNLHYFQIPPKRPVPKAVFEFSDVIVATAGCANLSFRNGYKTISMNAENGRPLGVMGYTTVNSVFSEETSQYAQNLSSLLKDILIKKMYSGHTTLTKAFSGKGYEYQMTLINNDRVYWESVTTTTLDKNRFKQWAITIIIRLGLIRLFMFHKK